MYNGTWSSVAESEPATLNGWCDAEYGWGPTVPDGSALTVCFCATVLDLPSATLFLFFGIPRLAAAIKEPLVKPAYSARYNLKVFFTVACLACAILLALLAEPPSPALRFALILASLSWFLALALLIVGYYRHLPQFTCLRIWWVGQFGVNAIIFLMHAELHTRQAVHDIRGLYCLACIMLAFFSISPRDQPEYRAVVITPPRSVSPHINRMQSERLTGASISTPLLVPRGGQSARYNSWGSLPGSQDSVPLSSSAPTSSFLGDVVFDDTDSEDDITNSETERTLRRKLSNNLLISGASKSRYQKPLLEWNRALYGTGHRANHEETEVSGDGAGTSAATVATDELDPVV